MTSSTKRSTLPALSTALSLAAKAGAVMAGCLRYHRPVQQLDQHKAQGVVEPDKQAAQKADKASDMMANLANVVSESTALPPAALRAAWRCIAGSHARNVVLAHLGAALGDLGCQQRGAAGNQRADAAALLALLHQLCQQLHGTVGAVVRQAALQQRPHAQHALAQLAQAKLTMSTEMPCSSRVGINAGGRVTAGVQPLFKALHRQRQGLRLRGLRMQRVQQRLQVGGQVVKGSFALRVRVHALAQLWRKANAPDLADAISQRVLQRWVPHGCALLIKHWAEHLADALRHGGGDRRQPLRVATVVQHQRHQR